MSTLIVQRDVPTLSPSEDPSVGTLVTITIDLPKTRSLVYSDEMIIEALEKTHGLVTHASNLIGCSSAVIWDRMKSSAQVKSAIRQIREMELDESEMALFRARDRGEPWAVALHLKTIGKHRGFSERQELVGKDGAQLFGDSYVVVIEHGEIQPDREEVGSGEGVLEIPQINDDSVERSGT